MRIRSQEHEEDTATGCCESLLKPFKRFRKRFASERKKDDDEASNLYGSMSSLKFSEALDYFDILY